MPGWNTYPFDDTKWLQAEVVSLPGGKLEAQLNRNMKVMDTVKPIGITESAPGSIYSGYGTKYGRVGFA